ncbi:hypothetical protein ABZ540_35905 [Nocardia xishanensis]|uniref:hypothetical protein n=1 Tax=Nocardia xishanensis TaxID=238964 RepID=UPI0033D3E8A9
MTVHREGEWLIATRSNHVAAEKVSGWFRLSFLPDRLVSGAQAVAGLRLAELVEEWDQLLWESSQNIQIVWGLVAMYAEQVGLDGLDAVIRVQQSEWPTTASERAEGSR